CRPVCVSCLVSTPRAPDGGRRKEINPAMKWSILAASALSLLTVASASAQSLAPGLPTQLGPIPGLPTAPGMPPTQGITLDQSRAAYQALAAPTNQVPAASDTITAVFLPTVGVLSVMGTAGDDSIVVSRDAAGRLLVNGGAIP